MPGDLLVRNRNPSNASFGCNPWGGRCPVGRFGGLGRQALTGCFAVQQAARPSELTGALAALAVLGLFGAPGIPLAAAAAAAQGELAEDRLTRL